MSIHISYKNKPGIEIRVRKQISSFIRSGIGNYEVILCTIRMYLNAGIIMTLSWGRLKETDFNLLIFFSTL